MAPQPDTLTSLVKKARECDRNWRMFTNPNQLCQNPQIQEFLGEEMDSQEINVFEGEAQGSYKTHKECGRGSVPRGRLTSEERKHHFDINLCFYYGKPNHKAKDCVVCLYQQTGRQSSKPLQTMDFGLEEQEQDIYPIDNTNLGQLANTARTPPLKIELMKFETTSFYAPLLLHHQREPL